MAGKSVLVVDTPKTCKECRCQMMLVCVPADEDIDEYVDPNTTIPKWCPLKPLPRKAELENYSSGLIGMVDTAWMKGYNECLEYIVGETK